MGIGHLPGQLERARELPRQAVLERQVEIAVDEILVGIEILVLELILQFGGRAGRAVDLEATQLLEGAQARGDRQA